MQMTGMNIMCWLGFHNFDISQRFLPSIDAPVVTDSYAALFPEREDEDKPTIA